MKTVSVETTISFERISYRFQFAGDVGYIVIYKPFLNIPARALISSRAMLFASAEISLKDAAHIIKEQSRLIEEITIYKWDQSTQEAA